MARPNYQFAKRSREVAQQKKREEKRLRKLARQGGQPTRDTPPLTTNATPPPAG